VVDKLRGRATTSPFAQPDCLLEQLDIGPRLDEEGPSLVSSTSTLAGISAATSAGSRSGTS
jgi:hypothetical protein